MSPFDAWLEDENDETDRTDIPDPGRRHAGAGRSRGRPRRRLRLRRLVVSVLERRDHATPDRRAYELGRRPAPRPPDLPDLREPLAPHHRPERPHRHEAERRPQ